MIHPLEPVTGWWHSHFSSQPQEQGMSSHYANLSGITGKPLHVWHWCMTFHLSECSAMSKWITGPGWAALLEFSNGVNRTKPSVGVFSGVRFKKIPCSSTLNDCRLPQSEKLASAVVWLTGCHISSNLLLFKHKTSIVTPTNRYYHNIIITAGSPFHTRQSERLEREILCLRGPQPPAWRPFLSHRHGIPSCWRRDIKRGRENTALTDWNSSSSISEARSRGMQQLRQLHLPGTTERSMSSQTLISQHSRVVTTSQEHEKLQWKQTASLSNVLKTAPQLASGGSDPKILIWFHWEGWLHSSKLGHFLTWWTRFDWGPKLQHL